MELPQEEVGKGTCGLLFRPAATVTLPKGVWEKMASGPDVVRTAHERTRVSTGEFNWVFLKE